jgi:hypothetical protein
MGRINSVRIPALLHFRSATGPSISIHGELTTEHVASSDGQPVFVRRDGARAPCGPEGVDPCWQLYVEWDERASVERLPGWRTLLAAGHINVVPRETLDGRRYWWIWERRGQP